VRTAGHLQFSFGRAAGLPRQADFVQYNMRKNKNLEHEGAVGHLSVTSVLRCGKWQK